MRRHRTPFPGKTHCGGCLVATDGVGLALSACLLAMHVGCAPSSPSLGDSKMLAPTGDDASIDSSANTNEIGMSPPVTNDAGPPDVWIDIATAALATEAGMRQAVVDTNDANSIALVAAGDLDAASTTALDSAGAGEASVGSDSPEGATVADGSLPAIGVDSGQGPPMALDGTSDPDAAGPIAINPAGLVAIEAVPGDASSGGSDAPAETTVAISYVPPTGGYSVRSATLLDTSRAVAHLLASADFYVNVRDPQDGGFYTYLDRQGRPTNTNKSFVVQSRDAYAFVRAFMVSGNEAYLTAARAALDFLYAHGWDPLNGGFIFMGDQQGNPQPSPAGVASDKWSFTQHYALVGPTSMCEATASALDCGWVDRGVQVLETRMWDSTPGRDGYFTNANMDFSSVSDKGFTPTVDGITTHALYNYLVTPSAGNRTRFLSLSDDIVNHLVSNMTAPGVQFGYPELYNTDWSIQSGNTYGFVGHLYKSAWCLARAYLVQSDVRYRDAARRVLVQMWNGGGFDHVNGAPNYDFQWNSGVGSTDKEYWQIEQGFTAGITNWYIADSDGDRAAFLEMADRSLDFFMSHLPDDQYGGIFFQTNADGSTIVRMDKGDQWEGAYHNVELSYYAYLYGNLMLWRKPVTLFYRFDSTAQDRTIALTPLAIQSEQLVVSGVQHDGVPDPDFNGTARTLHLPAGTGGVFAVTFAHTP